MFVFRLEIYTDHVLISGNYSLQMYRRLSDALNSDLHRFILLTSAIVTPIHYPTKAERVSELLVDRHHIQLVATLKEPDPPDTFTSEQQVLVRDLHHVIFYTSSFMVRGDFYQRPNMSFEDNLNQIDQHFIPINEARITPLHVGKPFARSFVCLGYNQIQSVYSTTHFESI